LSFISKRITPEYPKHEQEYNQGDTKQQHKNNKGRRKQQQIGNKQK